MNQRKQTNQYKVYDGDYGSRRNHKQNWRAGGMANAFKQYLDYYIRMPAMRMFYHMIEECIRMVYKVMQEDFESGHAKKSKAQLSVCYSNYPAGLASLAACGHTAWVQYLALGSGNIRFDELKETLIKQLALKIPYFDTDAFKKVFDLVARAVGERLTMQELSKSGLEQAIEAYRFFLASSYDLRFESLAQIIRGNIMFGDLFPAYSSMKLHPMTAVIFQTIHKVSNKYYEELSHAKQNDSIAIAHLWIEDLCWQLARLLPTKADQERSRKEGKKGALGFANLDKSIPQSVDESFPGLNTPSPPLLEEPVSLEDLLKQTFTAGEKEAAGTSGNSSEGIPNPVEEMIKELFAAATNISKASDSASQYDDIRSDLIMQSLTKNPFEPGLIQGTPTDGNDVEIDLGNKGNQHGQIFDQTVALSENLHKMEELIQEALPLTNQMKRNIFPNTEQLPESEKLRVTGMLDPSRLSYSKISDAIYKRFVHHEVLDKRGKPIILIACDGSGSMHGDRMHMVRILVTSWLISTEKTTVQIMAGIYDHGTIDGNRVGSKVRWIVHPAKTPATSKKDAVRAVASLTDQGGGGQEDALSIGYMLQEAEKFSRGKRIYMIHITDTGFGRSFNTELDAKEEVAELVSQRKEQKGDLFHYTLVALDVSSGGILNHVADKVICLKGDEISNPMAAASKIGLYVSSCLKERTGYTKKRNTKQYNHELS